MNCENARSFVHCLRVYVIEEECMLCSIAGSMCCRALSCLLPLPSMA